MVGNSMWRTFEDVWSIGSRHRSLSIGLRYPRAVLCNKTKRAGLNWFQRHATPKKGEDTGVGFEHKRLDGDARVKADSDTLPAQLLPKFDPNDPNADLLYGYDLITKERKVRV